MIVFKTRFMHFSDGKTDTDTEKGMVTIMNKNEFLTALSDGINGIPESDRRRAVEYYSEMIDDRIEEGCTEEEAVLGLGNIDDICRQILMEAPLPYLVKAAAKPDRRLRAWEIVLLILGSPVWVPLAFTAVVLILVFWLVLWAMAISLYALDLSLALVFPAGIVQSVIMLAMGRGAEALLYSGTGFICLGIAILLFFALNKLTKCIAKLCALTLKGIKSLFIRKNRREGPSNKEAISDTV